MTTIKIIRHITTGDAFTAAINDGNQIVEMSGAMYYRDVEAGRAHQDLATCDDPIEMDDYRVVNDDPQG